MLFLRKHEVLAVHARAIEEFGGLYGVRDEGVLEGAPIAAENRAYYEQASLITCAATYAYHLTQAHAFLDGNKRVAAAVAEIFLELNGAELRATDDQKDSYRGTKTCHPSKNLLVIEETCHICFWRAPVEGKEHEKSRAALAG